MIWHVIALAAIGQPECTDLRAFRDFQNGFDGPDCSQAVQMPEMVLVAGGGAGPSYDFWIGKYEVTNAEFAAFLNDAEVDGGLTGRGAYLWFQANGDVWLPSGTSIFRPHDFALGNRIVFNPQEDSGRHYRPALGSESHPVLIYSRIIAAKYCNWLTIATGLGEEERCFSEGPSSSDWHPITIATGVWPQRDLNASERQTLVDDYRGFRLPMDNLGSASGYVGNQVNPFNEWYKAAAYDPAGPANSRVGPGGETVPARHWIYGCGREAIVGRDANFEGSCDPNEEINGGMATLPVGYFDGINWAGCGQGTTRSDGNHFGLRDASGNAPELVLDKIQPTGAEIAVRGGSAWVGSSSCAASVRSSISTRAGFRLVRVE